MQSFVTQQMQQVEPHQKLFDEMLNRFSLSAKVVGEAAGVSEVMVSRFRRGKVDLGTAKFIALLSNVPQEARDWYLSELLEARPEASLRSLVLSAGHDEIAEILHLLAERWEVIKSRQTRESTDRDPAALAL